MPAGPPVRFPRQAVVPAGETRYEALVLSNDSEVIESVRLGVVEGETLAELPPDAASAAELSPHGETQLDLVLKSPAESGPGIYPYTLVASFMNRQVTFRVPGLRIVPPRGAWRAGLAPVQTPPREAPKKEPTADDGTQAGGGKGEGTDAPEATLLRPWAKVARFDLTVTNERNAWLYVEVAVQDAGPHWEYRQDARGFCLPPWEDACRPAVPGGEQGAPAPPHASPPQKKLRLEVRPRKARWSGKLERGAEETRLVVTVTRVDPETGEAPEKRELSALVRYVPTRGIRDYWHAFHQWLRPIISFGRWIFSYRGLVAMGGIGALIYVFSLGGPLAVYYNVRDWIYQPRVRRFEAAARDKSGKELSVQAGEPVVFYYTCTDTDEVSISGTKLSESSGGGSLGPFHPNGREGSYAFRPTEAGLFEVIIEARRKQQRGKRTRWSPWVRGRGKQAGPILLSVIAPDPAALQEEARKAVRAGQAALQADDSKAAAAAFSEAEAKLLQVQKENPRSATTANELGMLYVLLSRFEEAEKQFLQAKRLAPGSPIPAGNLAELYVQTRQPREAVDLYSEAVELAAAAGDVPRQAKYQRAQAEVLFGLFKAAPPGPRKEALRAKAQEAALKTQALASETGPSRSPAEPPEPGASGAYGFPEAGGRSGAGGGP